MNIETFLRRMFRTGTLAVALPGGRTLRLGDGEPPRLAVRISDRMTLARILANPSLGVGEAYVDGRLVMERGTICELIELASRNTAHALGGSRPGPMRLAFNRLVREHNARRNARRNVAHHYDLSERLYRAFLDEDMQYSCAYFARPGVGLEEAQTAKKRHIAAKLALAESHRVLDIGCGWGGLALSLADWTGARVEGITLSAEQLAVARARAQEEGLADRVSFSLTDYRDLSGRYDRVVSVGMFEHVGRPNYQAFFDKIASLLADDGVAVIHSIGRSDGPNATDAFTAKYIFPGGYIPALSEVLPAIERAGLRVTDIEVLRLHYAETLKEWRSRFEARREEIAALYDERFCRMWEFYLAGAEMGFRYGAHMNFQIQMTRRIDALPMTRDYMGLAERTLAESAFRARRTGPRQVA